MTQYIKLEEKDVVAISREYDLRPIGYESLEEGAGNTDYLVRTSQAQYVLTIFELEHIFAANLGRLLYLLEEFDFPATRIQELANGHVLTSYQGKPVLLKPHIVGQTSLWRFWKFNIDTPMAELSDHHWGMVDIAEGARAIPNEEFMNTVFS